MQNEIVEDLENYKKGSNEQLDILIAKYSVDAPPIEPPIDPPVDPPANGNANRC